MALLLLPGTSRSARAQTAAAGLAGGGAYVLATIASPKTGGSPMAGPNLPDDDVNYMLRRKNAQPTPELDALLRGAGTQWSAAVEHSSSAADIELASGAPVMAIGGFTGSDPTPDPAEFDALAEAGKVRYHLNLIPSKDDAEDKARQQAQCEAQNPDDPARCEDDKDQVGPQIEAWVKAHAPTPAVLGNMEVYDLSKITTW